MNACAGAGLNRFFIDAVFDETVGEFRWSSNNETVTFANWAPNEPNNFGGNEQCVMVFTQNAAWNDARCDARYHTVCQVIEGA